MNTFGRPRCLEGTQTRTRGDIHDWIDSKSTQNIYWLHGVAGSGKSTIATTIADELRETHRLGAFLFFGRDAGKPEDVFNRKKSDPKEVIRTIAFQLAKTNPVIATHVADGALGITLDSSIAGMFEKLILDPLEAVSFAPNFEGPIVIMLDALDECGTESTRVELLRVLEMNFSKLPHGVRILITSRPIPDLRAVFSNTVSVRVVQLDHESEASRRDVSAYLSHKLTELFKSTRVRTAREDKLLVENIRILCEAARGLFVWASTSYRHIAESKDGEFNALANLVENIQSQARSEPKFGLDELYSNILKTQIQWDNEDIKLRFQRVLYLVLEDKLTLSIEDVDDILNLSPRTSSSFIVTNLQSVLAYTPGSRSRIRPLHASFSDFLKSDEQKQQPWYIDVTENSRYFTQQCCDSFDNMDRLLRFNICDFETSYKLNIDIPELQSRIKEKISVELKDACVSWAKQLHILPFSPTVVDKLSHFLQNHMLFWLEVLSLIGEAGMAPSMLVDAIRWTAVSIVLV